MKTVMLNQDKLYSSVPEMPNFVVWDWMRRGLNLKGSNLLIFAYLYSQSFDGTHACTTSLATMSEWFGLTRQTISKTIDSMPYIKKLVSQEHNSGSFYTYNYYRVDIDALLQYCHNIGGSVYESYMLSYKQILQLKFPEDEKEIDEYFESIMDWHSNLSTQDINKVNAIAKLGDNVRTNPEDYIKQVFSQAITSALEQISTISLSTNSNTAVSASKTPNNAKSPAPTRKRNCVTTLLPKTKSVKSKSKEQIRNENLDKCSKYLTSFIALTYNGDRELEESLQNYLSNRILMGLSFDQWRVMLDSFHNSTKGMPISELKSIVDKAFIGNYKNLYYGNSPINNQSPIKKTATVESLLSLIDEFVINYGESNEELKEVLYNYAEEVAYINGVSVAQFKQLLNNLHRNCPQLQDKLISVQDAFAGGWKSFVPVSTHNNKFGTQNNVVVAVDMDKKMECIDNYISYSYWYQYPNIKKLLVRYINETNSGKGMTLRQFKDALMYLRLHSPQANDVERGVSEAIMKDTKYLCREDFKDTAQANKAYNSLEDRAHNMERNRRAECEKLKKANPNNPIVANLELPKELDLSGWGDRPIYTSQDIEDFDAFREKCMQEQQIDKYVCQHDRLKQYFEE